MPNGARWRRLLSRPSKIASLLRARAPSCRRILIRVLAIASSFSPGLAVAETLSERSTATGTAQASIVEPISISTIADLDFGGVKLIAAKAGSVTIDPSSATTSYQETAKIDCSTADCLPSPATYLIRGAPGRRYRVELPDRVVARSSANPEEELIVSKLEAASINLPGEPNRGLIDSNGRDQLRVGGTLIVPAKASPGHYSAQVTVAVTYE